MSEAPAKLLWNGKEIELPVVRGSENEYAIDISKLRGADRADHPRLRLREHRLHRVGDHVHRRRRRASCATAATTSRTSPNRSTPRSSRPRGSSSTASSRPPRNAREFSRQIRQHTLVHEDVKRFYYGFPKDAHPMATTASVVNALATFYQDSEDPHDPEQVQLSIVRLMAKLPTVAAYSYKQSIGQPFLYPDNSLDLIENFLRMMFAVPSEPYEVSPTIVHALKQLLILHADHEQNCSTSTVRMVGSAEANLYASIAAGIDALWGPLHGGANQACRRDARRHPRPRRRRERRR